MAHDIFISYRREDARADAGRLYDRLSVRFGDDHVFMDIEDIDPGQNFVQVLDRTIGSCAVMIVLIGKRWLGPGIGRATRLDDPNDFVRIEVEQALARGLQVIPVLVGGAEMPGPSELPESLGRLATRQAFELSDARFHADAGHLIRVLEQHGAGRGSWGRSRTLLAAGAVLILLAVGALVVGTLRTGPTLATEPRVLAKQDVLAMLVSRGFFHARWHATGPGVDHRYALDPAAGEPVVIDSATGLGWQKGGSGRAMPYARAAEHVAGLNRERFGGHTDWRLPTLEEAMSLNQPDDASGWHLDPLFEPGPAAFVWTSDTAPDGDPWVVYYLDGTCRPEAPGFNAYVRAVRSVAAGGDPGVLGE